MLPGFSGVERIRPPSLPRSGGDSGPVLIGGCSLRHSSAQACVKAVFLSAVASINPVLTHATARAARIRQAGHLDFRKEKRRNAHECSTDDLILASSGLAAARLFLRVNSFTRPLFSVFMDCCCHCYFSCRRPPTSRSSEITVGAARYR